MKRIIMLMAFIAIVITSSSAPRDMEHAYQIAKQLAKRQGLGSTEPQLKSEASPKRGNVIGGPFTVDQTYYYIFNYGDAKGYAIVSGYDTMPEIVGYATEGDFDENNIPESMSALLSAYRSTVDKVIAGDKQALQNVIRLASIRKAADGTS
ncbi:MAG: Spi family protease inhibitor, partial [Prevotella sp.]